MKPGDLVSSRAGFDGGPWLFGAPKNAFIVNKTNDSTSHVGNLVANGIALVIARQDSIYNTLHDVLLLTSTGDLGWCLADHVLVRSRGDGHGDAA